MGIVNLLGSHALFGALMTVFAIIAWLTWDYGRLSGRFLAHPLTTRRIAITLTAMSIVLIGTRFLSVLSLAGGK